ncbi:MAG TPA: hypothetical protein VG102_01905 [Candidatus Paceibacterota bacterium]|jgi:hypothetical protein|nr:hypothetical protein [Candidatus Paceibacterota bacterium]
MKKTIIGTAVFCLLALASTAFAQSTVTGTLSSGGSSGSTGSGNTVTGTVGSGNSLTGTVTSPSSSSGGGGGGGGGNGPPVSNGGGGPGFTIICPNLPNSLYALPAGYEILNGNCVPIGTVTTTPGVPNTGGTGTTVPGIPNTGAGGNAESNDLILALSGLLGATAGITLLRRQFSR